MIFCSNCGKANEESANFCPNCGSALHKNRDRREEYPSSSQNDNYDRPYNYDDQPPISGGLKALFIIITLIFPLAGIIIGVIYLNDPLEGKRSFGKKLLIFSIVWTILAFILPIIAIILFSVPFGHHYMYF